MLDKMQSEGQFKGLDLKYWDIALTDLKRKGKRERANISIEFIEVLKILSDSNLFL